MFHLDAADRAGGNAMFFIYLLQFDRAVFHRSTCSTAISKGMRASVRSGTFHGKRTKYIFSKNLYL